MTQDTVWFSDSLQGFTQGLQRTEGPLLMNWIEGIDDLEPRDVFNLQYEYLIAPEQVHPNLMARRDPYSKTAAIAERLTSMAERGWLDSIDGGAFRNSEKGRELAETLFQTVKDNCQALETLPDEQLNRAAELLFRVVTAARGSANPPGSWCVSMGKNIDPGPDGHPLHRVRRYLLDMNAFRDDTHLAAWRDLDVSGPAWEALTFVWRDQANTAAALVESLGFRGWSEVEYQTQLDGLEARGWLSKGSDGYQVSDEGRQVREAAEARTEVYFNAPWAVLSLDEINELQGLIADINAAMAPEEE
jgi:hypothetical protein